MSLAILGPTKGRLQKRILCKRLLQQFTANVFCKRQGTPSQPFYVVLLTIEHDLLPTATELSKLLTLASLLSQKIIRYYKKVLK